MPKLKITVFLIPNEDYKRESDPSWPKPAGVKLHFNKEDRDPEGQDPEGLDPEGFPATDATGVTSHDLPEGTYSVQALEEFADWSVVLRGGSKEVPVTDVPKDVELLLVPPEGKWLLPLHICCYGAEGAQIALRGVQVRCGNQPFTSRDDGFVYATVPSGPVTLSFETVSVDGLGTLKPQNDKIKFKTGGTCKVEFAEIAYRADAENLASRLAKITIEPTVQSATGAEEPLTGASATIRCSTPASESTPPRTASLGPGSKKICFSSLPPGIYAGEVTPPRNFNGWPVVPQPYTLTAEWVSAGQTAEHSAEFRFENINVTGRVQTTDGRPVEQELDLEICGSEVSETLTATGGTFSIQLDWGCPLTARLATNNQLSIGDVPLGPVTRDQPLSLTDTNLVILQYTYGITGQAVDEAGNELPGAVIDIFDHRQERVASVAAGADGRFTVGTKTGGNYFFAPHTEGGEPVTHSPVTVRSIADAGRVVVPSGRNVNASRATGPATGNGDSSRPNGSHVREALTDLAAYPVLTEGVTTTGTPAPSDGGTGGGRGAGYGQTVDQVIRDVLGWRPGGDVAGFQAALTGAFQLREVEGHTEWAWQQRGYAVQADMGALTGAQASIYERAKSALDQILPLLAGLTTLNPALFQPQDLEAIRAIITAELQELVAELALEGGPRIQRVDELFGLLLGEGHKSFSMNPDHVQGHLGMLRDRFGLTVSDIDTVDEERIVTNFRIIVEQILALHASWHTDRELLSGVNARTALGTILIWLSRGLEAICESVSDLTFALDSVYVDAAQRQIIELRFAGITVTLPGLPLEKNQLTCYTFEEHEAPLLLSDLLDWVLRASRDEGPRIIQDAGKDGVLAFAPVLDKLRILVHATQDAADGGATLPAGMGTPRVTRALEVLAGQLDDAADFAHLVRRDQAPQVTLAKVQPTDVPLPQSSQISVDVTGSNLRKHASAVLIAENHEELPDIQARSLTVTPPGRATATFRNPMNVRNSAATVTWLLVFTNDDGAQSSPVALTFS
jgi:hypothetical protein